MWGRLLKNFFSSLFEIFSFNQCLQCQRESVPPVCAVCLSQIERVQNGEVGPFSFGRYEGVLKNLIHLFKYQNKFALAPSLAKLLLEITPQNTDIIIPVPLYFKKLQERKYNQAVLLGQELSKMMQAPLSVDILKKTLPTPSQTALSQSERQKSILNVFSVEKVEKIIRKHVALLDDVYTTGATAKECERVLLEAGAQKVSIITLARSQ